MEQTSDASPLTIFNCVGVALGTHILRMTRTIEGVWISMVWCDFSLKDALILDDCATSLTVSKQFCQINQTVPREAATSLYDNISSPVSYHKTIAPHRSPCRSNKCYHKEQLAVRSLTVSYCEVAFKFFRMKLQLSLSRWRGTNECSVNGEIHG